MATIKETVYKDIPLSFSAHPVTGNLTVLKNGEAVKNSVKNIILTNYYERPYRPYLGGNVTNQIFELFTSMTTFSIRKSIVESIKNSEPRAQLDEVRVLEDKKSHSLEVTVIFRVINSPEPVTLTVILERVR